MYSDFVKSWRDYFVDLLLQIRDEWPSPESSNGEYEWLNTHEDGESYFTFKITTGDSLYFSFQGIGPAYTGWEGELNTGWYSPVLKKGRIEQIYNHMNWREISEGYLIGALVGGMSIAITDSAEGGGYLEKSEPTFSVIEFMSGWDGHGHGWYWSLLNGSGYW